jgi:16S rRNA G1207 methylase RsmC
MISDPLSTNGSRGIFTGVPPKSRTTKGKKAPASGSPEDIPSPLDASVNKVVPFRFSGKDMIFKLSHGLFSSYDIDEGTRLLLKSIAQQVDLADVETMLDVGCGAGVIGVSICHKASHVRALMQDRDALAVAFARENARCNGAAGAAVDCGLAFSHMPVEPFDLIACNIPAKAGEPVLRSFFRDIARFLSPRGKAAVVIVSPLAELALAAVEGERYEITHREQTRDYLVLHFRPLSDAAVTRESSPAEALQPYIRSRQAFSHAAASYEIDTAWSLPDFDTLGYALQAAIGIIAEMKTAGELLFWNPGQGHLPLSVLAMNGPAVTGVRLASRDSLELAISEWNIRKAGCVPGSATTLAFEEDLRETAPAASIDFLCAVPHPIPRAPWQSQMTRSAAALLRPGGCFLLAATSTEVHRFLAGLRGFQLLESRKIFGHRAVLAKKLP